MNVQVLGHRAATPITPAKLAIADCDIHPSPRSARKEVYPFLEKRWQDHLDTYGMLPKQGFQNGPAYPKGQPDAARRDSYVPGGGYPGSDVDYMRSHHLDPHNIQLGILNPLQTGQGLQNLDLAAAYSHATNDWQIAEWLDKEPRLKGSVVVSYEDSPATVAEIDRRAGDPHFVQVLVLSRTAEPLGQRRYWPMYEAACRANLPVAVHAFGFGGYPVSGGGWPSYYIEDMTGHAQASQAVVTSLVMEGVFEQFPALKVIVVEGGFGWLPALSWRLDKVWNRLRDETPRVKRPPSEYIRQHIWLTTQPMEEPDQREHLLDCIEWIGWDRLCFATDYPHWDFDDPAFAIPLRLTKEQQSSLFYDNARRLYGLA
jgi:uncharacterized protein